MQDDLACAHLLRHLGSVLHQPRTEAPLALRRAHGHAPDLGVIAGDDNPQRADHVVAAQRDQMRGGVVVFIALKLGRDLLLDHEHLMPKRKDRRHEGGAGVDRDDAYRPA